VLLTRLSDPVIEDGNRRTSDMEEADMTNRRGGACRQPRAAAAAVVAVVFQRQSTLSATPAYELSALLSTQAGSGSTAFARVVSSIERPLAACMSAACVASSQSPYE